MNAEVKGQEISLNSRTLLVVHGDSYRIRNSESSNLKRHPMKTIACTLTAFSLFALLPFQDATADRKRKKAGIEKEEIARKFDCRVGFMGRAERGWRGFRGRKGRLKPL